MFVRIMAADCRVSVIRITFDPTNRNVGGRDLIPVAVARDISQCTRVSGSFFGPSDSFLSMGVTVSVTA